VELSGGAEWNPPPTPSQADTTSLRVALHGGTLGGGGQPTPSPMGGRSTTVPYNESTTTGSNSTTTTSASLRHGASPAAAAAAAADPQRHGKALQAQERLRRLNTMQRTARLRYLEHAGVPEAVGPRLRLPSGGTRAGASSISQGEASSAEGVPSCLVPQRWLMKAIL